MVRVQIFLGLFALIVVFLQQGVEARTEPADLAALIAFRNSFTTFKPTWPLESVDPCDNLPLYKFTITCLPPTQPYFPWRVGKINLDCYGLKGVVPNLQNFTALRYIDLGNNYLSGTINDNLFPNRLMYINLFNNSLVGTVPSFSNLTDLRELYLSKNSLSGTIPSSFGKNSTLRVLSLNSNNLTGTIPSLLANNPALTELFLANNSLRGSIPSELGKLSNLLILSLWKSGLSGTIPSQLVNMRSLRFLYLDRNSLTGTIPNTLGNFTDLRILYLRDNSLTGTIPTRLGNLNSLSALSLARNNLTGPIPSELGNLSNLTLLHIYLNPSLGGTIPGSLGFLTKLEVLDLSTNLLTGTIPYEFINLLNNPKFRSLNLSWNNLYGNLTNTFFRNKPVNAQVNLKQNTWFCGTLPLWCSASGDSSCVTNKCLLAPLSTTNAPNVITKQKREEQATESVTLNWLASSTDDESVSVSYEAEMSDSDSENYSLVYQGKAPSATIHGLSKGLVYQFRIRAIQDGVLGPWSDTIKAMVK